VDIAPFGDDADPAQDVRALGLELKKYDPALYRKTRWLVFNKTDLLDAQAADARIRAVLRRLRWKGAWFKISALSGEGCREVCAAAHRFLHTPAARAPRRAA